MEYLVINKDSHPAVVKICFAVHLLHIVSAIYTMYPLKVDGRA